MSNQGFFDGARAEHFIAAHTVSATTDAQGQLADIELLRLALDYPGFLTDPQMDELQMRIVGRAFPPLDMKSGSCNDEYVDSYVDDEDEEYEDGEG